MTQTKVIQIVVKDGVFYGLTDEGHLSVFDSELSHWVTRGSPEIKNAAGAVQVRSVAIAQVQEPKKIPDLNGKVVIKPYRPITRFEKIKYWIKNLFNYCNWF